MTIQTNITANRKALAKRISDELLGAPVTYAGVPTCAYRVGACITIDREGNIEITDNDAVKILMPFFIEEGWCAAEPAAEPAVDSEAVEEPVEEPCIEEPADEPTAEPNEFTAEEPDEPEPDEPATCDPDETVAEDLKAPTESVIDPERVTSFDECRVSLPANMTVAQLTNLVHMLYSEQRLLNKAAMDGRLTIPESLITRLAEHTPETPEAFSDLLRDFEALGELTGFNYEGGIVRLDFAHDETHPEYMITYAGLVGRILHAAREATRVKAELQTSENEKYYMRAWLLRLGYGGADLKEERRLLLRNLKGHSAFPTDAAAIKHREKYTALRRTNLE
ncbi:MAG: hypothetical protein RSD95_16345, partial [Clostridia bacterium]